MLNVEINMINVENGDAIILTLEDADRKALVIIDGGRKKHYSKLKKRLNELLCEFNNEIALLVCTHYDNDHIGGVNKIIDEYHAHIQEIWMHSLKPNTKTKIMLLEEYSHVENISESYKELQIALNKIEQYGLASKLVNATYGTKLKKFPELFVISPSQQYYNFNLPKIKNETFIFENDLTPNLTELFCDTIDCDYTSQLQTSSLGNSVSAVNMMSIVILLNCNNKKYLFTGDAGIETFESIKNWKILLNNLFFLDLPHHGSKNNTSQDMLDVFKPKIVFVSANNSYSRPFCCIEKYIRNQQTFEDFEVTNSDNKTWYLKLDKHGIVSRIPIK